MSEKLKVIQPFEPKKLSYSYRELEALDKQGQLDFNIPIQRELKWQDNKAHNDKSLLIFSMLLNEPIGLMHCNFKDGVYSFLDGKQRNNTVFAFMRGEFPLKYLPLYYDPFTKETINLNGKYFKTEKSDGTAEKTDDQLSVNLQEKITSYKPEIYFYENLTDAQQAYVFKSINNGVALTNSEKARVEFKDQDTIVALAQHELIILALTNKQIKNRDDESIVKNIWGVFNIPNVAFLDKLFTPIIQDVTFTDEQKSQITNVLDRLLECYNVLKKKAQKESDKKVKAKKMRFLKKVFKKVHIPTMAKVILKSIQDGISAAQVSEWILHFFDTEKGSSISDVYNAAALGGSASATAVKTRLYEVMKDYELFINGVVVEPEKEPEVQEKQANEDITPIVNESESVSEATNDVSNEVVPEVKETSQTAQEQAQITFNENQAKLNEQAYKDKQKSSHKKK